MWCLLTYESDHSLCTVANNLLGYTMARAQTLPVGSGHETRLYQTSTYLCSLTDQTSYLSTSSSPPSLDLGFTRGEEVTLHVMGHKLHNLKHLQHINKHQYRQTLTYSHHLQRIPSLISLSFSEFCSHHCTRAVLCSCFAVPFHAHAAPPTNVTARNAPSCST